MYTRVVQKLVEKLCLKHKLSLKNEHGCSNWEQFRAIFVTRLSSQHLIFVSTGTQAYSMSRACGKDRGGPWSSLVFWSRDGGGGSRELLQCPTGLQQVPESPVNHTGKEIFTFKYKGCSSSYFWGSAGYWISLFNTKLVMQVINPVAKLTDISYYNFAFGEIYSLSWNKLVHETKEKNWSWVSIYNSKRL